MLMMIVTVIKYSQSDGKTGQWILVGFGVSVTIVSVLTTTMLCSVLAKNAEPTATIPEPCTPITVTSIRDFEPSKPVLDFFQPTTKTSEPTLESFTVTSKSSLPISEVYTPLSELTSIFDSSDITSATTAISSSVSPLVLSTPLTEASVPSAKPSTSVFKSPMSIANILAPTPGPGRFFLQLAEIIGGLFLLFTLGFPLMMGALAMPVIVLCSTVAFFCSICGM